MTFEELKKEFIDHGFTVDGDSFVFEKVEYNTININGQVHKQPVKSRFELRYFGEGSISDVGDSDGEVFYEFDVIGEGGEPAVTICISSFDEFTKMV